MFADHLFIEKDYLRAANEYERFLFITDVEDDSLLFKSALCYQLIAQHQEALAVYKRIANKASGSSLDSLVRQAVHYSHLKLKNWEALKEISPVHDNDYYFIYYAEVSRSKKPVAEDFFNAITSDSLRNSLRALENNRQNLSYKSPLFSGFLSTLLPGLGKAYYGRSGDSIFSLAAVSVATIASSMAFKENREITGLITGAMAASFYMGTIYGSYIGTTIYNQNLYESWILELDRLNPVDRNPYWELWQ